MIALVRAEHATTLAEFELGKLAIELNLLIALFSDHPPMCANTLKKGETGRGAKRTSTDGGIAAFSSFFPR